MAVRQEVGRYGENVAARCLEEEGWEVLARNWRCASGELDIVAADGDVAVAVEVKTRRSAVFGSPADAVTAVKLARLRRLMGAWLAGQERVLAGVRIDVIAVVLPRAGAAHVEHLRGVG